MTTTKTLVTIFLNHEFGFGPAKHEGWLLEHGRRPYAQYPTAPFVKFVPRGKRNPREWVGSYKPFCVILAGHGLLISPAAQFLPCESTTPGVTVTKSRYSFCDDRFETDFNTRLNSFLAEHPETLVADYRWTTNATGNGE